MRRALVATVLVAPLAVATLTGCGLASGESAGQTETELAAALGPEGMALAALGYDPDDLAAEDPVAADDPEPAATGPRWRAWRERRAARITMRRNTLHGELVVRTADGTRTVLVQRGEVTAVTDTALTVTSADGFSQTWTFGERLRVIEARSTVTPEELTEGDPVGVAGARPGGGDGEPVARLVLIPDRG